jgi:anti-sigma factor RsiW
MTCDELLAYLSSFLDGELDESLSAAARAHLATCQNCTVVLDTTRSTILIGKGEGQRIIPAERRAPLFRELQDAFLHRAPRA